MTIYLYTGTPGSGKSLHMASIIRHSCRMRKPVVANFDVSEELNHENFFYLDNETINPAALAEISQKYPADENHYKEGRIKLFIDECQIIFNARNWNDAQRKEWVKFFTQHRKLGYDVYLVSQFDQMVDKQIRALTEYEVKHRKVNNYGWFGRLMTILTLNLFPVFCSVTYWYGMKTRLGSDFFIGRKSLYRTYDTQLVFESL